MIDSDGRFFLPLAKIKLSLAAEDHKSSDRLQPLPSQSWDTRAHENNGRTSYLNGKEVGQGRIVQGREGQEVGQGCVGQVRVV